MGMWIDDVSEYFSWKIVDAIKFNSRGKANRKALALKNILGPHMKLRVNGQVVVFYARVGEIS